jgi:hypothetical protein
LFVLGVIDCNTYSSFLFFVGFLLCYFSSTTAWIVRLANTTTSPNNRIGKFFYLIAIVDKQPLIFFSFSFPSNNTTANPALPVNLVIHPVGPLNRSLAKIVLKDFIKTPKRALNATLANMENMAMLLNKQPYLHAKVAAKVHIWINLDNQNVKTALLDNLEMWKQQQQLKIAKNVQPAKTNRHQDNLNATHVILGITKLKTPKRIVCRAYLEKNKATQGKHPATIAQWGLLEKETMRPNANDANPV